MKISRENQHTFADIALRALARGLCAVSLLDKRVAADVEALGDGFSFAICAGTGKNSPAIKLKADAGRFSRDGSAINASDVVIRFKDVSGLMPVLSGQLSVASSFAQHRILVSGNMNHAVMLVRIIEIAEAYLFPKFIIKKAMRRVPKKRVPRILIYIMMLFFGSKGPPHIEKTAETASADAPDIVEATENTPENTESEKGLEAVK